MDQQQDKFDNTQMKFSTRKQEEAATHQMNVQPGYTKFVIDEHKADYDYIKGKFTDEEIKEAFSTLDINKTRHITGENLTFFLEYLGEKATEEEIEEMIKMCDIDGNGQVSYDEFYKLATGQSLAPIGQAYTPNPEMQAKREKLEQLMKDENDTYFNTQIQNKQKKFRQQMREQQQQLQQTEMNQTNNEYLQSQQKFGNTSQFQPNQSQYTTNPNASQQQKSIYGSQPGNQNSTKINSFYMGGVSQKETIQNQNRINDYYGSIKQFIYQRQKLFSKLVKEYKISGSKIREIAQMYINDACPLQIPNFEEFAKFLNIPQDSRLLTELYNNLIDVPMQEEQGQINNHQILDVQDIILMLVGTSKSFKIIEKYDIAFRLMKEEKITKQHLFQIILLMTFKAEIDQSKLEEKIQDRIKKYGIQDKGESKALIDKMFYDDLINSFPTYFY